MSEDLKAKVGEAVCDELESGMRLGIGTGSTAEAFIRALAPRVRDGLDIIGVPTSERTRKLCEELGIALTTLDELPELDLTIDGADEIDPQFSLIKGGGGALLREKIVAAASERLFVIADESKMVPVLGPFGLPIELNLFGLKATTLAIQKLASRLGLDGPLKLRMNGDKLFITDGGHCIIDASFGLIPDAHALDKALLSIPGVVQHGLFVEMTDKVFIAGSDGIRILDCKNRSA